MRAKILTLNKLPTVFGNPMIDEVAPYCTIQKILVVLVEHLLPSDTHAVGKINV